MGRSREPKVMAAVLVASALGSFALAFHGSLVQETEASAISCALALHGALPLADVLLGMLLGLAGLALWRRSPQALLFGLPAGMILWCRAAQDALFHLLHGASGGWVRSGLLLEAGVDLVGFVLGTATIAWIWRWQIPFAIREGVRDTDTTRPATLTALGIVLLLAAAAITAAWVGWFTTGRVALASQPCVIAFADSLLLAEGGLALVAALGGTGVLRGRSWGLLYSLMTSGGLAFVAAVEALFFAQQLGSDTPEAGLGPVLVLMLTVTSLVSAAMAWRYRAWLLADHGPTRGEAGG